MKRPERAQAITLANGDTVEPYPHQFLERSESGKSWGLWEKEPLRFVRLFHSRHVMWVHPIEEENDNA